MSMNKILWFVQYLYNMYLVGGKYYTMAIHSYENFTYTQIK